MNKKLKIFLVKPAKLHLIDDVLAYFDTQPKAEKFIERFGKSSKLEIQEKVLNPSYHEYHPLQPYLVVLGKYSDKPYDHYSCPAMYETNYQIQEGYTIEACLVAGAAFGIFEVTLLASSAEEALAKAISIRNAAVSKGEWDTAEQHLGQKKQFRLSSDPTKEQDFSAK